MHTSNQNSFSLDIQWLFGNELVNCGKDHLEPEFKLQQNNFQNKHDFGVNIIAANLAEILIQMKIFIIGHLEYIATNITYH